MKNLDAKPIYQKDDKQIEVYNSINLNKKIKLIIQCHVNKNKVPDNSTSKDVNFNLTIFLDNLPFKTLVNENINHHVRSIFNKFLTTILRVLR